MKKSVFIGLLFVFGFLFRLWLNRLAPQPLNYDQNQYFSYAFGMLHNGLFADPVRLYGYPLLIVPLLKFFSFDTQWPYLIAQSAVDTATGLMVLGIAGSLFPKKFRFGVLAAYILYLINPYTAAYAGSLLTEITAICIVTAVYVLMLPKFAGRPLPALLTIFLLGFLPHVRPSFFYLSLVLCAVLLLRLIKTAGNIARKSGILFASLAVFLAPFTYTVTSNIVTYGQFSLLQVDDIFTRELYLSNFIGRGIPFSDNPKWHWPQVAYETWWEYSTPKTPAERRAMSQKYREKSMVFIRENPGEFIDLHFRKLFYVWEKHFLFPYVTGPDSPSIRFTVYWANVVLLCAGFVGTVWYSFDMQKSGKRDLFRYGLLAILLYVYISAAHVFSTSEERFSLPAYPVIIVFAGYLIGRVRARITPS